jgi:acyl-CoA thioesterase-1
MFDRRRLLAAAAGLLAPGAVPGFGRAAAPNKPPVVTLLGDSITAGLGLRAADALPAQLQIALQKLGVAATVRGAGVSGDTTAGGLARIDFSVQQDTAVCVVELGGNDLLQSIPPAQTRSNLTAIVNRLKARKIRPVLVGLVVSAPSSGSYGRDFTRVFPAVAKATGAPLAPDLLGALQGRSNLKQRDGLHPSAEGVKIIAAKLAPVVARALKTR